MSIQYLGKLQIEEFNIHHIPNGVKFHTCPLCSHTRKKKTQKCATVYWEYGFIKCSHCGEVIQLHKWKKSGTVEYKIPEWKNNTELSANVVKWFESRGISQFTLRLMKIGEGIESMPDKSGKWKDKNTTQFNYFRNSDLVNTKYRGGDKSFKLFKGAEKIPYNLDNIQGQEIIYCVEGEMDVLAVMECGIHNVTSPPNGFTEKGNINLDWINNDVDHFLKAQKLILAFDNDIPGENGKKEFIRRFGSHKCYTVDLKDCKDSNEYLLKYGKEALKTTLENHIEIPLENVSSYSDHKEKVRNFFLNGMPRGLETGTLKDLDKNFSVNYGHVVLVTGIPSSGKSEIVDEFTAGYAIKYGINIGYASPENKPNEIHLHKLIKKIHGSAPTTKNEFDYKFEFAEKFIDEHFYLIDLDNGYDLEKVLMKGEELVHRKGIRILVLDPFNKIILKGKVENVTGNRINDYTREYLTKINEFAYKNDVLVILVAHPNKMEKMSNGQRVIPDFYDVKGGGEFYDMCHHGLVVHRDYLRGLTMIRTLKVKFSHLGEINKDAWFKFNPRNGRMSKVYGNINEPENIKIDYDNENWLLKKNIPKTSSLDFEYENNTEHWGEAEDVPF